jgi:hypothetical protein
VTKSPERKDESKIDEIVRDTAKRKHRAAQARSQPRAAGAEEPRAVYLAACEQVAAAFTPENFRYAKSRRRLIRIRGDWKEIVSFQSDHNNVPGERVGLWTHAYLENTKLLGWRKQTPSVFRRDAWVAGGQIGNLHRQHRWIDWDLAALDTREATVLDVIREIRETALACFALVEEVPMIYRKLLDEDVPSLSLEAAVDLLLCYLGRDQARSFLRAWRARHTSLEPAIQKALADVSPTAPIPGTGLYANSPFPQVYAVAVRRYGLD